MSDRCTERIPLCNGRAARGICTCGDRRRKENREIARGVLIERIESLEQRVMRLEAAIAERTVAAAHAREERGRQGTIAHLRALPLADLWALLDEARVATGWRMFDDEGAEVMHDDDEAIEAAVVATSHLESLHQRSIAVVSSETSGGWSIRTYCGGTTKAWGSRDTREGAEAEAERRVLEHGYRIPWAALAAPAEARPEDERGASAERAAVVRRLRECAMDPDSTGAEMRLLQEQAASIERGDHLRAADGAGEGSNG